MDARTWMMGVVTAAWAMIIVLAHTAAAANYEYETSPSGPTNTTDTKEHVAACSPGTVAVGGGFVLDGAPPRLLLTANHPVVSDGVPVGWRARAQEEVSSLSFWNMRAFAVCAPATAVLVVTETSPVSDGTNQTAESVCPGELVALGGGGELSGGLSSRTLSASEPLPFGITDGEQAVGWRTGATEVAASEEFSSVTTYAICGHLPDVAVHRTTTPATTSEEIGLFAECPNGQLAIGSGWNVRAGTGVDKRILESRAVNIEIFDGQKDAYQFAALDPTPQPAWSFNAYVMCAPEPSAALLQGAALLAIGVRARRLRCGTESARSPAAQSRLLPRSAARERR